MAGLTIAITMVSRICLVQARALQKLPPSPTSDTPSMDNYPGIDFAVMSTHFASGRNANYLNADEVGSGDAVSAAFGPNWARLKELKRRYDPDNAGRADVRLQRRGAFSV